MMSATPVEPEAPPRFDCLIVLGARVRPDGTPSAAMHRRVATAIALARNGTAAHLLMSGGAVGHAVPEARVMRALALAAGIAPERVLTEERSGDTIGNARHCHALVAAHGWTRLAVVSDGWHLPRVRVIFAHVGLTATTIAATPTGPAGPRAWAGLREIGALAKTLVRLKLLGA